MSTHKKYSMFEKYISTHKKYSTFEKYMSTHKNYSTFEKYMPTHKKYFAGYSPTPAPICAKDPTPICENISMMYLLTHHFLLLHLLVQNI